MIAVANTEPIALSMVEGCAQSPRYEGVKIGLLEGWNNGLMGSKPIIQYSNTPTFHFCTLSLFEQPEREFFGKL